MEGVGQHLDEFAEVDTCVGDVIEDGLVAISLIFHISDFHVELQFFGNLSRPNHGVFLQGFRLLIFVEVHLSRLAVDALDFRSGL